jgi:hypothetical protein
LSLALFGHHLGQKPQPPLGNWRGFFDGANAYFSVWTLRINSERAHFYANASHHRVTSDLDAFEVTQSGALCTANVDAGQQGPSDIVSISAAC